MLKTNFVFLKVIVYIFILFFLFPGPVYAYLDTGTGSYIFQILIAGIFAGLFFFKSIVKKIKSIFKKRTEKPRPSDDAENN